MALGARIRAYIPLGPIGPLAIVARPSKSYGQARMFMALPEADRPIKIFRELHAERRLSLAPRLKAMTLLDVAEIAAAALAGGKAGGAGFAFGLHHRRAAAAFAAQGLGQLEAPLLVGRAAVGAHAGLRERRDLPGQSCAASAWPRAPGG